MAESTKQLNADCSFCRKSSREVGPVIEGPDEVHICAECVELCQSIIDQEKRRRSGSEEDVPSGPTPQTIRERLDQLVTDQDEAKEALVLAAARRSELADGAPQSPLLLVGPTRSSKVFLARAFANAINVPLRKGIRMDEETLLRLLAFLDHDRMAKANAGHFV